MIDVTQVLNVSSLSAFIEEVPAGSVVRVEVSDVRHPNNVNAVTSTLTIHGGGRDGGLVELRYSVSGFDFSAHLFTFGQIRAEFPRARTQQGVTRWRNGRRNHTVVVW